MAENETITFTIDGQEVEAKPGETVLPAALRAGVEIPYYCYHPGLEVAGNCRMCLVETEVRGNPSLVISCSTEVRDGLEIKTKTDMVRDARESVMEFLLLNHPLDCPVCDQAGECALQEFAYRHGRDHGRIDLEDKVHKHTKNMGPMIALWGERCIACTRCVRFCNEISGTGELTMVNRADKTVVDVFPGIPLDNPLAGNTVDICPVGALVSRDFLFKARAWFMESRKSICSECSKGCNTYVEVQHDQVYRIRPRPNLDVNEYWMCDYGRAAYRVVHSPERLSRPILRDGEALRYPSTKEAVEAAGERLRTARDEAPTSVGILASAGLALEELHLVSELAEAIGTDAVGFLARPDGEEERFPGFVIEADKNANRGGLTLVFGDEIEKAESAPVIDGLEAGTLKVICIVGGLPEYEPPDHLLGALEKADFILVIDSLEGPLASEADLLLPGAVTQEKEGTFINSSGRIQRFWKATDGPGDAAPELQWLQRIHRELTGEKDPIRSAGSIFDRMAGTYGPLNGLTYRAIGTRGLDLENPDAEPDPLTVGREIDNIPLIGHKRY